MAGSGSEGTCVQLARLPCGAMFLQSKGLRLWMERAFRDRVVIGPETATIVEAFRHVGALASPQSKERAGVGAELHLRKVVAI